MPDGSAISNADERRVARATPWLVGLGVVGVYAPSLALGWWREDFRWLFGPLRFPQLLYEFANPDTLGRYRPVAKLLFGAVGALGLDARVPSRVVCLALMTATAVALAAVVRVSTGRALAGLLAALVFLSNQRMLWVGTFVTFWGVQLYLLFACVALMCFARAMRERSASAAAGAAVAMGLACGSFELAPNIPLALGALAVLRAVRVRNRPRLARPAVAALAVGISLGAFLTVAQLLAPGHPATHVPALGRLGANLAFVASHESDLFLPAAISCVFLLAVGARRAAALDFTAIALVGLVPGALFPAAPDSYMFSLSYLGAAALVGTGVDELFRRAQARIPARLRRSAPPAFALLATVALGMLGHSGMTAMIASEWDMRDSRRLLDSLGETQCFGHRPAWVAPLGLDGDDRKTAITTSEGGRTPFSELCGTPVLLELDPTRLAEPECRDNAFFLTRDGRLIPCATLAADPSRLASAIACGAPPGAQSVVPVSGDWTEPPIACVSVLRGMGASESETLAFAHGPTLTLEPGVGVTFAGHEKPWRVRLALGVESPATSGSPLKITVYAGTNPVQALSLTAGTPPSELMLDVGAGSLLSVLAGPGDAGVTATLRVAVSDG